MAPPCAASERSADTGRLEPPRIDLRSSSMEHADAMKESSSEGGRRSAPSSPRSCSSTATTATPTTILDLPEPVLALIFGLLAPPGGVRPHELRDVALACRAFRVLALSHTLLRVDVLLTPTSVARLAALGCLPSSSSSSPCSSSSSLPAAVGGPEAGAGPAGNGGGGLLAAAAPAAAAAAAVGRTAERASRPAEPVGFARLVGPKAIRLVEAEYETLSYTLVNQRALARWQLVETTLPALPPACVCCLCLHTAPPPLVEPGCSGGGGGGGDGGESALRAWRACPDGDGLSNKGPCFGVDAPLASLHRFVGLRQLAVHVDVAALPGLPAALAAMPCLRALQLAVNVDVASDATSLTLAHARLSSLALEVVPLDRASFRRSYGVASSGAVPPEHDLALDLSACPALRDVLVEYKLMDWGRLSQQGVRLDLAPPAPARALRSLLLWNFAPRPHGALLAPAASPTPLPPQMAGFAGEGSQQQQQQQQQQQGGGGGLAVEHFAIKACQRYSRHQRAVHLEDVNAWSGLLRSVQCFGLHMVRSGAGGAAGGQQGGAPQQVLHVPLAREVDIVWQGGAGPGAAPLRLHGLRAALEGGALDALSLCADSVELAPEDAAFLEQRRGEYACRTGPPPPAAAGGGGTRAHRWHGMQELAIERRRHR